MPTSTSVENEKSISHSSQRLGLIGLGLMGAAITQRLRRGGFEVFGWDICSKRCAEHLRLGGTLASNIEEVFSTCRSIILSLPNDEIVSSVLASVQPRLRERQIIIDTSTGDPQATIKLASWLAKLGVDLVDATVSGSSLQLLDGLAMLLVGASENAFDSCQPILRAISTNVVHVGPTGKGSQLKLVTNLVLGLNRAALAEGLAYAQALGLPLKETLTILRESMAYSRIMDSKGEKMIGEDFTTQAKLSQHAKDVLLMLNDAERNGLELPLTLTHQQLLHRAIEQGLGDLDNSAIIQVYRNTFIREADLS